MTHKEQDIVLTLLKLAERKLTENPFSTAAVHLIDEALTLLRETRGQHRQHLLPNKNKKHD